MSSIKKGKILDAIVALLERSLSNDQNLLIEQNKKIFNKHGIERELDVYIETKVNKRKVSFAIECKNYNPKNRVQIDEIEAFNTKCNTLNIQQRIFVTTSEFQRGAITTAKEFGIELCRISVDNTSSFSEEFDFQKISFFRKRFLLLDLIIAGNPTKIGNRITLFDQSKRKISWATIEKIIGRQSWINISDYLLTEEGLLLNKSKVVRFPLKASGVFIKKGKQFIEITQIVALGGLEILHNEIEKGKVRSYRESINNTVYATFSSVDIVIDETKYSFNIIKSDEETRFFMMPVGNSRNAKEFKEWMKIDENPIKETTIKPSIQYISPKRFSYGITDNFIDSVKKQVGDSNKKAYKKPEKHNVLVTVDAENKQLRFMNLEKVGRQLFASNIPNPVSMCLSYAIEEFNEAERLKKLFPKRTLGKVESEHIYLLDDFTFFQYLQRRMSAVFMLRNALNSMFNELISSELNEDELQDVEEIENTFDFKGKFDLLTSKIGEKKKNAFRRYADKLVSLDQTYNDLSNLKTAKGNVKIPFIHSMEPLIKVKLEGLIKETIKFVQQVSLQEIIEK